MSRRGLGLRPGQRRSSCQSLEGRQCPAPQFRIGVFRHMGRMRGERDVLEFAICIALQEGLLRANVQPGMANVTFSESVKHGLLVDDLRPCRVD